MWELTQNYILQQNSQDFRMRKTKFFTPINAKRTGARKTKAERFPELSVSLLGSLEVTQRLASRVARSNSASRF